MVQPRGYLRKDVEQLYNPIQQHGIKSVTETLSASNLEEIKIFGDVAAKVSVQASGTLVCTVSISVNGTDFIQIATLVDKLAIVSYETHNVSAIKIVRTAGEGKLHILGSI